MRENVQMVDKLIKNFKDSARTQRQQTNLASVLFQPGSFAGSFRVL
jgi:hypothetical protein